MIDTEKEKMRPTKTLTLNKSPAMIRDGHGEVNATVLEMDHSACSQHKWSLVYRWGKKRKLLAAETYIKGFKVQLHRFIQFEDERKPGVFVIPKDGNALNCIPLNMEVMTKEEAFNRPGRPKKSANKLNEEQQKWLDDTCVKRSKTRWELIGEMINSKIDQEAFD